MLRKERKLPTVIDGCGNASKEYHVEGILSIVVIDRDGRIVSYYLGNQSEQSLRAVIDLALKQSHERQMRQQSWQGEPNRTR